MIHYHSRYYIHGHTDWQYLNWSEGKGTQSGKLVNNMIPLSTEELINLLDNKDHQSQTIYRRNERQTWLRHFRTSKPLSDCFMRQPIKVEHTSKISVLLIDSSRSMRQNALLEWLENQDLTIYDYIFLHREELYPYPASGIEKEYLEGGTSYVKPIHMIITAANRCNVLVNLYHVTDGRVSQAEQPKLTYVLSGPILSYRQIRP